MTRLRALIVDDEYPARAELRFRLGRHPDVEVTGEAATAREALRLIEGLAYDVVFLDIAMPGLSGIEMARQLRDRPGSPSVIFVTAYDAHAVAAFETRALDYLLKPFDDARLADALDRVRARVRASADPGRASADPGRAGNAPGRAPGREAAAGRTRSAPRWLVGMRDQSAVPIPLEDIVFVSAEQDRVYLHTQGERFPTRHSLRELEALLPPQRFFRCHRAYLVNLAKVREISPYFNGTYSVTVLDRAGTTVPVARSRVAELKRFFWPRRADDSSALKEGDS